MRKISILFLLLASVSVHAETLVIAGTGDSQNLLRKLAPEFQKRHPGISVDVPDSIGSRGGIKAVDAGNIELARTARPVKPSEAKGLVEYRFAIAPLVLVAHSSAEGVDNVTSEQVLDIYAGRIDNWNKLGGPRHRLYAVDREQGDSSRSVLEKKMEGFKAVTSKAKIFYSTPDAVSALNENEFTFGYLPMSEVKNTRLNVLKVDGVEPSTENITSGSYPYAISLYLVTKGEAKGLPKKFIDFARSKQAQKIITDFGLIATDK